MIARAEGNKLIRVPVVSQRNGKQVPGGKGTLRDSGTRVPLIANWTNTIKGRQVVDDLVDMSDFWPTLLELAGALPSEQQVDGISFASRLTKGIATKRTWAYSQSAKNSAFVRNSNWKLYKDGRLVDMRQDSSESNSSESNSSKPGNETPEQHSARRQLQAALKSLEKTDQASDQGKDQLGLIRRRNFKVTDRDAFVIEPPRRFQRQGTMPWVWYAPTLTGHYPGKHEAWMVERFHQHGIALAGIDVGESYGSPNGRAAYQALYEELTTHRGYRRKPVLLARSRGGLMLYSWAAEHPELVGGIAGIYPVCNLNSYPGLDKAVGAFGMSARELKSKLAQHNPIDRLALLAKAQVPIFHIHGDQDKVVPLEENSAIVETRYRELGGPIEVQVIPGQGHNLWTGWFQSRELTEFVISQATKE